MGFNFYEGYGLTETAPVLTVTPPDSQPVPGSVGKPLPGVDVKIDSPDGTGVGEVLARGRNLMLGYWRDEEATSNAIRDGWFHTGDLGRFDADGNLFIVGRSKEVIIDSNGKNVFPDEVEELYRECPFIKHLSVVGLPEGTSEHVAAAVVPNLKHDEALSRAEVEAKVSEHFQAVSAQLPHWKRVKTLEFWEGEDLPRTSSRKIKRAEVVAELVRRHRKHDAEAGAENVRAAASGTTWFLDILAEVTGRSRATITWKSKVSELGLDSLTSNELAEAVERAGVTVPGDADLSSATDVAALYALITQRASSATASAANLKASRRKRDLGDVLGADDIEVPDGLARLGRKGIAAAQQVLFRRLLETKVEGQLHIPAHTHFIVAANHSSHLDMGVVKVALGDAGKDLASLAAADYFFSNRWRKAYFANFTNLVPMERLGSIRKSMDVAERVLRRGRSLVVFPEGTRSLTGRMAEFLPSLGYLALRAGTGILPAHIAGSYEALPKGSTVPKSRDLRVRFGPFLAIDHLQRLTEGLPQQEGWRLVAGLTQRIVEGLRDGRPVTIDAAAVRAAWDGEHLGPLERTSGRRAERGT
jgi:long-chain acyl-CoA synthetase